MIEQVVTGIEKYNQIISEWISKYYADGIFLIVGMIAFVYLYTNCKELRIKYLLPIALMIFITVNPIIYKVIFSRIVYWRLLWLLPNTTLIAMMVVIILKKQCKIWYKWGILITITIIIASSEKYMFSGTIFSERSNWEKVSQETKDVCDIMLELDRSPRAVVNSWINTEIRQYAPEIELLYGREVTGNYIRYSNSLAFDMDWRLKECPSVYDYVMWQCYYHGYNFLIVSVEFPVNDELLKEYEYSKVGQTEGHIIYYNLKGINYSEELDQ